MAIATAASSPATPAAVEFALLQSWLASGSALQLPLHEIESRQQDRGREVQRLLLQAHLQQRGNGDVGPALYLRQQGGEVAYSHRRLGTRSLTTVFGTVELVRMGYSRPGMPGIFPLAVSYTHLDVYKRQAQDFDAFYWQHSPEPATGSLLVAAVDCKGIPMVKPPGVQPTSRLTKGQKVNKKRMATVATVFTRAPWVRTPQQVAESLFRISRAAPHDAPAPPRPENKRVWASLLKGKDAVIQEVGEERERRDPSASKTRVALTGPLYGGLSLTDGERALQIRVERKLKVTLILDLMHALEKLWKAAYVFHAEGSLEADLWVMDRTLRILEGGVGQVVKGLRQSITKRNISGAQRKTLEGVAEYLYRNRARMHYHEYLANGWPIASGPVEGACKSLIKDRMERSGMRWTEQMAEAIVQLRAVYLSGRCV